MNHADSDIVNSIRKVISAESILNINGERIIPKSATKRRHNLFDGDGDSLDYYAFLTSATNFMLSIVSVSTVLGLIMLKSCFTHEDSTFLVSLLRGLALLPIISYFWTLRRLQCGKSVIVSLRVCGDAVMLQRALIGGCWIYMSMKNSDTIPFAAALEFFISVGAILIFGVHSWWAAVVMWIAHAAVISYSTLGSIFSSYLDAFVLCLIVAVVTLIVEIHQFDAYKSFCDKQHLVVQLKRKNEEMRSLIGNVAHDLKTPLQAIVSGLEDIPDDKAETRESLQGIADFMVMMVNRSIDFTKVQSGYSLKPILETINIASCVDWVTSTISHTGKPAAVSISVDYDLASVQQWVISDKHWLLENLLCYMSNAVKFVVEGSIVLRVSAEEEEAPPHSSSGSGSGFGDLTARDPVARKMRKSRFSSSPIAPLYPTAHACGAARAIKFIHFTVEDTGVGIPEDKMGGLFQPFFQTQKGAGGTGLGLYALAKRMEALGGRYGVSGREDGAQGSRFWFSIPYRPDSEMANYQGGESSHRVKTSTRTSTWVKPFRGGPLNSSFSMPPSPCSLRTKELRAAATAAAAPAEVTDELLDVVHDDLEAVPAPPLFAASGARVLLVDDSHMVQKMSSHALKKAGFRVTSALNGVEGLRHLKEARDSHDPFDLVLMDLQMPVLDGLETTIRIRSEERLLALEAGVPHEASTVFPTSWALCNNPRRQYIVGLSANSDPETIASVSVVGMDNFIAKPLRVSHLKKLCEPQKVL